ncbi:MAG: N-acetylmuramoyl-L-alanine amidase, partial [bacterium]
MRKLTLAFILIWGIYTSAFAKSMTILDPGHGGSDLGCDWGGYIEATETLKIAQAVMNLLDTEPDIDGTMTRTKDVYMPIEDKGTITGRATFVRNVINQGSTTYDTFIFLSIHLNAGATKPTSANGIETYFYNGSSLAKEPHEFSFYTQYEQVKARGLVLDKNKQGDRGLKDGNVESGRMGMLRTLTKYSPKPHHSSLVEIAFLTNPDDYIKSITNNPNFIQEVVAPAIVSGIKDILKENRKPQAAINIIPPSPIDPSKYSKMTVRLATSKRLASTPDLRYTPRNASSLKLYPQDRGNNVSRIRNIMWEATTGISTSTPRGTATFSYSGTDLDGLTDTTIIVGDAFMFTPTIIPTNQFGTPTFNFNPTDNIYIKGDGYASNTTYNLYVSTNTTWMDKMGLSGLLFPITTNNQGEIASGTSLGILPLGNYDLIVDTDNNGFYTQGIDGIYGINSTEFFTLAASTCKVKLYYTDNNGNIHPLPEGMKIEVRRRPLGSPYDDEVSFGYTCPDNTVSFDIGLGEDYRYMTVLRSEARYPDHLTLPPYPITVYWQMLPERKKYMFISDLFELKDEDSDGVFTAEVIIPNTERYHYYYGWIANATGALDIVRQYLKGQNRQFSEYPKFNDDRRYANSYYRVGEDWSPNTISGYDHSTWQYGIRINGAKKDESDPDKFLAAQMSLYMAYYNSQYITSPRLLAPNPTIRQDPFQAFLNGACYWFSCDVRGTSTISIRDVNGIDQTLNLEASGTKGFDNELTNAAFLWKFNNP